MLNLLHTVKVAMSELCIMMSHSDNKKKTPHTHTHTHARVQAHAARG